MRGHFSINQKLANSYDRDLLSHDLFDYVIDKEQLPEKNEDVEIFTPIDTPGEKEFDMTGEGYIKSLE